MIKEAITNNIRYIGEESCLITSVINMVENPS